MSEGAQSGQDEARAAAAAWLARLRADDVSPHDAAAFRSWADAAPGNDEAFRRADAAWRATGSLAQEPAILALRRQALAGTTPSPSRRAALAACAAALVLGAFGVSPQRRTGQPVGQMADTNGTYRTEIGQRLAVPLSDGSVLTLNTDTVLRVAYSAGERSIHLDRGQFIVEAAKNPNRPLAVYAGPRRIVATGTEFDVRLDADKVEVTLLEGRVVVDSATPTAPIRSELQPGERLVGTGQGPVSIEQVPTARLTSWRSGLLIFEDDPLAAAVAEVNRYSRTRIVLGDDAIRDLRVSGVFKTGQPDSFVAALTGYFPLDAARGTDNSIRLTRRATAG